MGKTKETGFVDLSANAIGPLIKLDEEREIKDIVDMKLINSNIRKGQKLNLSKDKIQEFEFS